MAVARAKPRQSTRYWFHATYKAFDGQHGVLEPKRGGRVVVTELPASIDEGECKETMNAHDSTLRLRCKEGDHLILCGGSLHDVEQTCSAVVMHVEPRGWTDRIHVRLQFGVVKDGDVVVLKAGRAA